MTNGLQSFNEIMRIYGTSYANGSQFRNIFNAVAGGYISAMYRSASGGTFLLMARTASALNALSGINGGWKGVLALDDGNSPNEGWPFRCLWK